MQKMEDMSDDSLEAASSHKTRDLMATKYKLLDGVVDLDQWEVRERYVLTRDILGDGTYGCVVKALDKFQQNKEIAIKSVDISLRKTETVSEVYVLGNLIHPNIVPFIDYFQSNGFLCIVMEMAVSDVGKVLAKTTILPEPMCSFVIEQVLQGLEYMHCQKIVHRDLNPSNILIYECGICKIADFGEACRLVDGEARGLRGTLSYMAPEVLRQSDESLGNVSGDESYGLECDIWSVGCIVIECIQGKIPTKARSDYKLRMMAINNTLQPYRLNPVLSQFTPELHNFIESTLVLEPYKRWTVQYLLLHEWIKKFLPDSVISAKELMNFVKGKAKPTFYNILPLNVNFGISSDSTATSDLQYQAQRMGEQPVPVPVQPIIKESIWVQLKKLFCSCCGGNSSE